MEFKLNEYCLNHVFSYLKLHDLIHVSEVCRFWKQVALRQWQKITKIKCHKYYYDKVVVISTQDVKKIVANAAQFVRVFNACDNECKYYTFGNHGYELKEHFDPDIILQVLIRNGATKVIEAGFRSPPKADLMRSFLQTNKVKKLRYDDFAGYHQHIPTDGIEHLTLHFQSIHRNLQTFKGHFRNLKKLDLVIETDDYTFLRQILLKILPYVEGITSFRLTDDPMYYNLNGDEKLRDANRIRNLYRRCCKMNKLLKHALSVNNVYKVGDAFLSICRAYCPKIRVVDIDMIADFGIKDLQSLMSLPHLKVLNITLPWLGLPLKELSKVKNLTSLKLNFVYSDPNTAGIFGTVKMMPKLQNIDFCYTITISKESQLQLIYDVVRAAILQGKDVLLSRKIYLHKPDPDEDDKVLKVERKTRPQTKKCETLHLTFSFYTGISASEDFLLLQDVCKFLQNELSDYHVFILKNICRE